jgi:hypothetical protein
LPLPCAPVSWIRSAEVRTMAFLFGFNNKYNQIITECCIVVSCLLYFKNRIQSRHDSRSSEPNIFSCKDTDTARLLNAGFETEPM